MSFVELLRTLWPIAATLTPILMAGGFAWLRLQFPTKSDLEKLRTQREEAVARVRADCAKEIAEVAYLARQTADRTIKAEEEIRHLSANASLPPSKAELSKDIGKVAERLSAVENSIRGVERHMETHNNYLHMLVDRATDRK